MCLVSDACGTGEDRQAPRPVARAWLHPFSFVDLKVPTTPTGELPDEEDSLVVRVSFKLPGRTVVPVTAAFTAPEPMTVTRRIVDRLRGGNPRHPASGQGRAPEAGRSRAPGRSPAGPGTGPQPGPGGRVLRVIRKEARSCAPGAGRQAA
ncbi:DUF5914 domain-containing protein [Streptomyces sp. NPDC059567]|uniref:DUF5914 domain-containing protein n=1 Tax=Streptomyces sp. NPDC059567 TaxID=3346867 RepID=UPI0036A399B5